MPFLHNIILLGVPVGTNGIHTVQYIPPTYMGILSGHESRWARWAGYVAHMEEMRNV
jgi:hypothetical protein